MYHGSGISVGSSGGGVGVGSVVAMNNFNAAQQSHQQQQPYHLVAVLGTVLCLLKCIICKS